MDRVKLIIDQLKRPRVKMVPYAIRFWPEQLEALDHQAKRFKTTTQKLVRVAVVIMLEDLESKRAAGTIERVMAPEELEPCSR